MIYFTSPQGLRRSHTPSPRQTPGTPPGWLQILGRPSGVTVSRWRAGGPQATVARRLTVPVTLDCRLPESVEVATYGVVAEAAKHAHPSRVAVSARTESGKLMRLISRRGRGTSLYIKIPLDIEH